MGVPSGRPARPIFVLVTLVPLIWLLSVTMTAGIQKIFSTDPRVGFLAAAKIERAKVDARALELNKERPNADDARLQAVALELAQLKRQGDRLVFNYLLDAFVAGIFLVLVVLIVAISAREWILLFARKRVSILRESEPVCSIAAEKPCARVRFSIY